MLEFDEIDLTLQQYPKLTPLKGKLLGKVDITDKNRCKILDTYEVEISYPKGYKKYRLPIVRELGSKIPNSPDRHINPDRSLCIMVRPEEVFICHEYQYKIDTVTFVDTYLIPYLATQTLINKGKIQKFLCEERSHGVKGIIEFWNGYLDTKDLNVILKSLEMVAFPNFFSKKQRCFCGSGKKSKRCHFNSIQTLMQFPKEWIWAEYQDIKSLVDKIL